MKSKAGKKGRFGQEKKTASNDLFRATDYHINTARDLRNLVLYDTPIRYAAFGINVTTSGSCQFKINSRSCKLGINDIVFITPDTEVEVTSLDEQYDSVIIFCKAAVIDRLNSYCSSNTIRYLASFTDNPVLSASETQAKDILHLLFRLKELSVYRSRQFYEVMSQNYFTSLLYEFTVLFGMASNRAIFTLTRKEELTAAFLCKVYEYCRKERRLDFFAGELSVTTKYLSEVCKELTGKTAGTIIDEAVILEAKLLLVNPGLLMSSVIEALNFSDQSLFGKFFKRYTGLTPSEYRVAGALPHV